MNANVFSEETSTYGSWLGDLKRSDSRFGTYLQSSQTNHSYLRLVKIGFERQQPLLPNRYQAFVIRQLAPETLLHYLFGPAASFVSLGANAHQTRFKQLIDMQPASETISSGSSLGSNEL